MCTPTLVCQFHDNLALNQTTDHIGFPSLMANFGLTRLDYSEHSTLHVFRCVIVDIPQVVMTLFVILYSSWL